MKDTDPTCQNTSLPIYDSISFECWDLSPDIEYKILCNTCKETQALSIKGNPMLNFKAKIF